MNIAGKPEIATVSVLHFSNNDNCKMMCSSFLKYIKYVVELFFFFSLLIPVYNSDEESSVGVNWCKDSNMLHVSKTDVCSYTGGQTEQQASSAAHCFYTFMHRCF